MRKTVISVMLVAILAVSGLLLGCQSSYGWMAGSGKPITQEMTFTDFSRLEIGSTFQVEVSQSSTYSVSITFDDNLLEVLDVGKSGDTLRINLKSGYGYLYVKLKAKVTMPSLRGLSLSGASRATVNGFNSTDSLDVEVSGASRATGLLTAGDVRFNISGASTVDFNGSASDISAEVSGASKLDLLEFTARNVEAEISGASQANVNLTGRLSGDVSGASRIEYTGEPTSVEVQTSGASTVTRKSD